MKKTRHANTISLQRVLLLALSLLLTSLTQLYADNNFHDSGFNSAGSGYNAASNEYEFGVIKEIRPDGTLTLQDGKRIKVPKNDLLNPDIYPERQILIFRKGGVYHLDHEGRIVGSFILLDAVRDGESLTPIDIDKHSTGINGTLASYNFAAKSTLALPVGAHLEEMLRQTSLVVGGNAGPTEDRRKETR